ncbi:MAG: hypothetical protein K6C10_10320 [Prevotella sp.]|nr:hypothetical protein [Prevotella sp.]
MKRKEFYLKLCFFMLSMLLGAGNVWADKLDGFFTIMNNGNEQFVNVTGRRNVTFVSETATAPGTVLRLKATDGQVEVLRSQGVDLPSYIQKSVTKYAPEFIELAVEYFNASGSGNILGKTGFDKIKKKFENSYDYHLYLEAAGDNAYRIYNRTPSMKPVVDFYEENKASVDAKLPGLEQFINEAIEKLIDEMNGHATTVLVPFVLHDIWEKMGGTEAGLREPVTGNDVSISEFYEDVLTSEANVWNFAYQTGMIYWTNLKNHDKFNEIRESLGYFAKYIDRVENIRPDVKYYIIQKDGDIDIASEENALITGNDPSTIWTVESRTNFDVTFSVDNSLNLGYQLCTTLYADFAYKLPAGVKAYKVTSIDETTGVAVREEITSTIPAQTPVLLVATFDAQQTADQTITLTLSTTDGTVPTDNLLVGADYLINEYGIKDSQVEDLFQWAHDLFYDAEDENNFYDKYIEQYEYLMKENSGTVNNKYFFGLADTDLVDCVYKNDNDEEECVVRSLSMGDQKLGFYKLSGEWKVDANEAFLVSKTLNPVKLTIIGDVDRDGKISISDVTATVNIILGKAHNLAIAQKYSSEYEMYDYEAADADPDNNISISDVTAIVNIILRQN